MQQLKICYYNMAKIREINEPKVNYKIRNTVICFISNFQQILAPVTPKWLQKWSQRSMHSLFHERCVSKHFCHLQLNVKKKSTLKKVLCQCKSCLVCFIFLSLQEQHVYLPAPGFRRCCLYRVHLWGVQLLQGDGDGSNQSVCALRPSHLQDLLFLPMHQQRSRSVKRNI